MSGDIDARLARLADIEAIIRLKHEYWNHNDSGFRADEIAALFTADGIWSNAEIGQYEGREAIRAFFQNAPAIVPFCAHVGMNPIIDLDRDQATGRWRALLLSTLNEPSGAVAVAAALAGAASGVGGAATAAARADRERSRDGETRDQKLLQHFNAPFRSSTRPEDWSRKS